MSLVWSAHPDDQGYVWVFVRCREHHTAGFRRLTAKAAVDVSLSEAALRLLCNELERVLEKRRRGAYYEGRKYGRQY